MGRKDGNIGLARLAAREAAKGKNLEALRVMISELQHIVRVRERKRAAGLKLFKQ